MDWFEKAVLESSIPDKDNPRKKKTNNIDPNTLDLHGSRSGMINSQIQSFIQRLKKSGFRKAVIITGKGRHTKGIISPVRNETKEFLTEAAAKGYLDFTEKEGFFELWLTH